MSIATEYNGYDPNNVVIDRQDWQNSFDDVLENSPKTADDLAHLLYYFLLELETGPDGSPEDLGERLNK